MISNTMFICSLYIALFPFWGNRLNWRSSSVMMNTCFHYMCCLNDIIIYGLKGRFCNRREGASEKKFFREVNGKQLSEQMNNGHFKVKMKFVWEKSVQKQRKYQEMQTQIKFGGPPSVYPGRIPSKRNSNQRKNLVLYRLYVIGQRPTSLFIRDASTVIR